MYQDPPLPIMITPLEEKISSVVGDNERFINYELLINNGSSKRIRLLSVYVECFNDNQRFKLKIKNLDEDYSSLSTTNKYMPEEPILVANSSGILYLKIKVPDKIKNIKNILNIRVENELNTTQLIKSNDIVISKCNLIINPPLKGNKWLVVNGYPNDGAHRRATFILNGNIKLPERFAVDLMKYGFVEEPYQYKLYKGNPYKNESYFSYGQSVYAVGDGTVFGLIDGIKDNIPGTVPNNITSETIGGNYIIIKLTEEYYAFYAHLIPGSIKVKIGEKVFQGQKIGSLGNSGNSSLPHLHFQICTKPLPIGDNKQPVPVNCQGLPWLLNKFTLYQYNRQGSSDIVNEVPLYINPYNENKMTKQTLMFENLVDFCKTKHK